MHECVGYILLGILGVSGFIVCWFVGEVLRKKEAEMFVETYSNPFLIGKDITNAETKAREFVRETINQQRVVEAAQNNSAFDPLAEDEVKLVWFSKTLDHWKALVCTTLPDDLYYEVTHNGIKNETYLDTYEKRSNVVIPD